jgi:hypothetical protein
MADARPSLTPEHRELLRHFVRLVDDMSRSRLIERYRTQDHTISRDGPDARVPDYDWEDFRSFLTTFRQVAISSQEPVYVFKVLKIVGRYASPQLREELGPFKKDLARLLEGNYPGIICLGEESGEGDMPLTSNEILIALINGQIFHADSSHRQTVEVLGSIERWMYLCLVLHELIAPTLNDCIWLCDASLRDGILDDADYPAHCRGTGPTPSG